MMQFTTTNIDEYGLLCGEWYPKTDQGDCCNREGVRAALEALWLHDVAPLYPLRLYAATQPKGILKLDALYKIDKHGLAVLMRHPHNVPFNDPRSISRDQMLPWLVALGFATRQSHREVLKDLVAALIMNLGFFPNSHNSDGTKKPWWHFRDIAFPDIWATIIRSGGNKKWRPLLYILDSWHITHALTFAFLNDGDDDCQWLLQIEQGKRIMPTFWIHVADYIYRKFRKIDAIESYYTSRGFSYFIPWWDSVRQRRNDA